MKQIGLRKAVPVPYSFCKKREFKTKEYCRLECLNTGKIISICETFHNLPLGIFSTIIESFMKNDWDQLTSLAFSKASVINDARTSAPLGPRSFSFGSLSTDIARSQTPVTYKNISLLSNITLTCLQAFSFQTWWGN